jgi:uncharacterized membrane protein YkvA (DUF1232 family)
VKIISQITDWLSTPYTIYLILKEPGIPRSVKIRAATGLVIIFAYLVSPLDIIPDFIPFAGWIDDLVIVPLGLVLLRKFTPGIDIIEKRNRAQRSIRRILLWSALALMIFIILSLLWLGLLVYLIVRLIIR